MLFPDKSINKQLPTSTSFCQQEKKLRYYYEKNIRNVDTDADVLISIVLFKITLYILIILSLLYNSNVKV